MLAISGLFTTIYPIFCGFLITAVLASWILFVCLVAERVRRTTRTRSHPEILPTTLEHLPTTFRPQLGESIEQMRKLGFVVVANVSMPESGVVRQVTQCLLVNRATQERAGIVCQVWQTQYNRFVAFVTEFSDGTEIKTDDRATQSETSIPKMHLFSVKEATVEQLYESHAARVLELEPKGAERVMPPEGQEAEYVAKRHAAARAVSMPKRGFVLDPTGQWYQLKRTKALSVAAKYVWPLRIFFRRRMQKGFPIESAPTDQAAPASSTAD
ncbi:MAG TPA: hypothetical protein VHS31_07510 [Tepidisphaeraceae bacterium]|jgi:hypothetical protein|nr:hypothetical protein [Tepidisphaeraceae bacterium]